MAEPDAAAESTVTVLVAGAANMAIAIAKAIAAVISGSAAMLSESAHSVADTVTEVLLLVAVRRGARPADDDHPLGHGREFYLWALLAAFATFVAGAGISILEGVEKLLHGESPGDPWVAAIVLVVAFAIESVSLLRALTQVRASALRWDVRPRTFLRVTTDTAVKAVTFEDTAALVGLVLAGAGLALTHLTGSSMWDGIASILIGVLLVVVAVSLTRANSSLLIGQTVPGDLRSALVAELMAFPCVQDVPTLVTSVLGPEQVLVAARVRFSPDCTADDIADVADQAEQRFLAHHPGVREVFLDPTPRLAHEERLSGS